MLCMSFRKLYQSRCGPEDVLRRSNLFVDRCEVRWDGMGGRRTGGEEHW